MAYASFSCTALVGTNKVGLLQKDADGYYDVVLGALDYFNSRGDFYPLATAKRLFESSSILMRRIKGGNLRGECGHPRKLPGQSMPEYIHRILDINEPTVSHHIREVWIDDKSMKDDNGRPIVLVRGWVRPAGLHGAGLQKALDNKHENVCFSIRSLTRDVLTPTGTYIKNLEEIITWDWVNEPGINVANKFGHPSLENMMSDVVFTDSHLRAVRDLQHADTCGLESRGGLSVESLISSLQWEPPVDSMVVLPASSKW